MMALIFAIAIVCFSLSYTETFSYTQCISTQHNLHSRHIYSRNIPAVSSLPRRYSTTTKLYNLFPKDEFDKDDFLDDDDDDDWDSEKYEPAVAAQIRKAKQLLNETKKKQKQQEDSFLDTELIPTPPKEEEETEKKVLPFFATKQREVDSTKIKSKTKSGEIIADGTQMATLSKSEAWERRSLSQMFTKEARQDWDGNDVTQESSTTLADKDVARSIYNLRKSMQNEDFKKVFDSRNRFIGEVE